MSLLRLRAVCISEVAYQIKGPTRPVSKGSAARQSSFRFQEIKRQTREQITASAFDCPSVPQKGQWQTVWTQIRCRSLQHLIRFYTICIGQMGIFPSH